MQTSHAALMHGSRFRRRRKMPVAWPRREVKQFANIMEETRSTKMATPTVEDLGFRRRVTTLRGPDRQGQDYKRGIGEGQMPAESGYLARCVAKILDNNWRRASSHISDYVLTRRLINRLAAFDRRFFGAYERAQETAQDKPESEDVLQQQAMTTVMTYGNEDESEDVEEKSDEEEPADELAVIPYTIVDCSSQRPDYPASGLATIGHVWSSQPLGIANQFVVLELEGKQAYNIEAVSFYMPATFDAGPQQGKILCSRESAEGPFREVWRFTVPSKSDAMVFTRSDAKSGKHIEQEFIETVSNVAQGSLENAWDKLMDVDGDGKLSYTEFVGACQRIRAADEAGRSMSWLHNMQELFGVLDEDCSGDVTLKDLQQLKKSAGHLVSAPWWKIVFLKNWGSMTFLQVSGPLKAYARVAVKRVNDPIVRRSMFQNKLRNGKLDVQTNDSDLTEAFSLETLEVDPRAILLRNLAKKHGMSIVDIEELHARFREVDRDGNGILDEPEFVQLTMDIHGAKDSCDIPKQRLQFYWQQADFCGRGEVDFEAFVLWFNKYGRDLDLKRWRFNWYKRDAEMRTLPSVQSQTAARTVLSATSGTSGLSNG